MIDMREHRRSWSGGDDIIVAVYTGGSDGIHAVTLKGVEVRLSLSEAPAAPVLALVPTEGFDNAGVPKASRLKDAGFVVERHGVSAFVECPPEAIECNPDGGPGGGYVPPPGAVWQRGIAVREFASHFRALNDHEPWILGAPEFVLMLVGTSNTNPAAELANRINIPENVWAGSDDDQNANWRLVPNGAIALADWDVDYGNRIQIMCREEDWEWPGSSPITVQGSTTLNGTNVSFSHNFMISNSSDDCGQYALLIRSSQGAWTSIPDSRTLSTAAPDQYDGTSDLQWSGYGMPLVP